MNKYVPFLLTFMGYFNTICLLSAYSFVKKDVISIFEISDAQMGYSDGLMSIGSVLGLIIYISGKGIQEKCVLYYLLSNIAYSACFFIILALSLLLPVHWVLSILSFLIGILRSFFWPLLLTMLAIHKRSIAKNAEMDLNHSKCVLTVWGGSTDYGFAFGFFASNIIVYTFELNWRATILSGIILNVIVSFIIYFDMNPYVKEELQK